MRVFGVISVPDRLHAIGRAYLSRKLPLITRAFFLGLCMKMSTMSGALNLPGPKVNTLLCDIYHAVMSRAHSMDVIAQTTLKTYQGLACCLT